MDYQLHEILSDIRASQARTETKVEALYQQLPAISTRVDVVEDYQSNQRGKITVISAVAGFLASLLITLGFRIMDR